MHRPSHPTGVPVAASASAAVSSSSGSHAQPMLQHDRAAVPVAPALLPAPPASHAGTTRSGASSVRASPAVEAAVAAVQARLAQAPDPLTKLDVLRQAIAPMRDEPAAAELMQFLDQQHADIMDNARKREEERRREGRRREAANEPAAAAAAGASSQSRVAATAAATSSQSSALAPAMTSARAPPIALPRLPQPPLQPPPPSPMTVFQSSLLLSNPLQHLAPFLSAAAKLPDETDEEYDDRLQEALKASLPRARQEEQERLQRAREEEQRKRQQREAQISKEQAERMMQEQEERKQVEELAESLKANLIKLAQILERAADHEPEVAVLADQEMVLLNQWVEVKEAEDEMVEAMLPDPPVPAELMSGFDRAVRMLAKRQAQEQLDTCVNQSAEPDSQQILPTEAADAAMSDAPSAASSSAVYAASPGLVLPPIQLPPILDPVARCDDALTLFECASRANKAMHEEASAHIQKWATQRNAEAWCNLPESIELERLKIESENLDAEGTVFDFQFDRRKSARAEDTARARAHHHNERQRAAELAQLQQLQEGSTLNQLRVEQSQREASMVRLQHTWQRHLAAVQKDMADQKRRAEAAKAAREAKLAAIAAQEKLSGHKRRVDHGSRDENLPAASIAASPSSEKRRTLKKVRPSPPSPPPLSSSKPRTGRLAAGSAAASSSSSGEEMEVAVKIKRQSTLTKELNSAVAAAAASSSSPARASSRFPPLSLSEVTHSQLDDDSEDALEDIDDTEDEEWKPGDAAAQPCAKKQTAPAKSPAKRPGPKPAAVRASPSRFQLPIRSTPSRSLASKSTELDIEEEEEGAMAGDVSLRAMSPTQQVKAIAQFRRIAGHKNIKK